MKKNIHAIFFDKERHWVSLVRVYGKRVRPVVLSEVDKFRFKKIPCQAIQGHQGMIAIRSIMRIVVGIFLVAKRIRMSGIEINNHFGRIPLQSHFVKQGLIEGLELGDILLAHPIPESGKGGLGGD